MKDLTLEITEDFAKMRGEEVNSTKVILEKKNKKVLLLNKKFIIKVDRKENLQKEVFFLEMYKDDALYEKVLYYNRDKGFVVYEYIEGEDINNIKYWTDVANILKESIKKYKDFSDKYNNILYCNNKNWLQFLKKKIVESNKYYSASQKENEVLKKAFKILERANIETKIIHGDLGIYNILFSYKNKQLKIIDPYPMVCTPNYDMLTYFCSSIKILDYFSIKNIIDFIEGDKKNNIYLFIIVLYIRIGIESKHNGANVNRYKDKLREVIEMEELL